MIVYNYQKRIPSFFEVYRATISIKKNTSEFNSQEKLIYKQFASALCSSISKIPADIKYFSSIPTIIKHLEELHANSLLEDQIQNCNKLIRVFIPGAFRFMLNVTIDVSTLKSFLELLKAAPENKQKVILNNLWERFDKIERLPQLDDLPF